MIKVKSKVKSKIKSKMKSLKHFLQKLLTQNSTKSVERFYQHADLNAANWISLAINKNSIQDSLLTKELDILTNANSLSLKIAQTNHSLYHKMWINQNCLGTEVLSSKSEYVLKFNLLIDQLITQKLAGFQSKLSDIDSKIQFTPEEISIENKALEWIRVSFELLKKAIIQSLTNSDLLFQTLIFIGTNPKSLSNEIRIITFNLDITFELLANKKLRVRIYNDKNEEFASNKKASLQGDFEFKKREIFDELIKLISAHSSGFKFIF